MNQSTCHCGAPLSGRQRSHCSQACANRAAHAVRDARRRAGELPTRPCDTAGCANRARSGTTCNTCANRRNPNWHRPITQPCSWPWCSNTVTKPARNERRVVCSDECRTRLTHGWSEELPADHEARQYGSCGVASGHCAWCGDPYCVRWPTATHCSARCASAHKKADRDARKREAEGTHTRAEVTALWIAGGKRCAYCHVPTDRDAIHTEHVIPLSHGGRNDLGNLLPSCAPCNTQKGARNPAQWDTWREKNNLPPLTANLRARWPHLTLETETDRVQAA